MPRGLPPWFERSSAPLAPLWKNMPTPSRAASEATFMVAAVLAPSAVVLLEPLTGAAVALAVPLLALLCWGGALLRGGARWSALPGWARAAQAVALAACLATAVVAPWHLLGPAAASGERLLGEQPLVAMTVRNLSVLGLVGLLLAANRQGVEQLGLVRKGMGAESLVGVAALGGAFLAHLAISLVLALVVAATSTESLQAEAQQRAATVAELVSATALPALAGMVMLAAAFEEVVFRGFVLPRARQALHGWGAALLLVSALFGLGHLYEGTMAVVQTGALGVYFGLLLLWRGRLLPAIIAHAGFNGVMVALALWLRQSGALEGAERFIGP